MIRYVIGTKKDDQVKYLKSFKDKNNLTNRNLSENKLDALSFIEKEVAVLVAQELLKKEKKAIDKYELKISLYSFEISY